MRFQRRPFGAAAVVAAMCSRLVVHAESDVLCATSTGDETCAARYYKISDENNGLATSCAAVDQTADPVTGLDQAGCQAACDNMLGCNTVNFRWSDPNFGGQSTCYRKNCENFKTAACTLFTKHKGRDVYTKACGAEELHADYITLGFGDLFAGVSCPDDTDQTVIDALTRCSATSDESCSERYYKISDQDNGLATSCAAVDQTSDPVTGLDQAGCQAACDSMDGCNTVNFRESDPNFSGQSTCYRKNCEDFETAVCTLFTKHKGRDVYTKACGAADLYEDLVEVDPTHNLFASVKCPSATGNTGEDGCTRFVTTNATNPQCDICYNPAESVRTCRLWDKGDGNSNPTCVDFAPSALELQQLAEYQEYLQDRWSEVGLCNGQYKQGTTCEIEKADGSVCEVRDQPCQGNVAGLGGVAGVLSKGWQMTFSTEQDNHVCTMCGRGTFGTCEDACAYRRNFFWSGYDLGRQDVSANAEDLEQLYDAFVHVLPVEEYDNPQKLELTEEVTDRLPPNHPMATSNLGSTSIYSIIQVNQVSLTVRDQLRFIYIALQQAVDETDLVPVIVSTSGVKVYETCSCERCPRGHYQDSLGETSCKPCEDILPGSDTEDMGADGPQLCQCLQANDNYLSGDESECLHCDNVREGTAAAPKGYCDCPYDTYEVVVTDGLGVPADSSEDWITCVACPADSSTFNDELTQHEYGKSIENCYCKPGWYHNNDGGCSECSGMKTSDWNAQSGSDCYLTDSAKLLAIALPIGVTVFGLLLGLIVIRYRAKIAKLEKERIRAMKERILLATESVNHLAHPMVLMTASNFLACGRMVKHEDARAQHLLVTIDTNEELKGFQKTNTLVFFSHQWLSWTEPDPDQVQFNAMASAMKQLVKNKNLDLTKAFVWLDYTSIPQTHRGLQRLSINSLPKYAGSCDYFVIIAPGPTKHANTGTPCDATSYQERAWCRAEQLAHGCSVGVENMFIVTDDELRPVTWDWIKPSFEIFNGNLTCCARGHEGMEQCDKEFLVTPVLGLYCELIAQEKHGELPREKKEVLQFMKEQEDKVFPSTFDFSTTKGKGEKRELFGDMLSLLAKHDAEGEILRKEVMTSLEDNDDKSESLRKVIPIPEKPVENCRESQSLGNDTVATSSQSSVEKCRSDDEENLQSGPISVAMPVTVAGGDNSVSVEEKTNDLPGDVV